MTESKQKTGTVHFGYEAGSKDDSPKFASGIASREAFRMPVFYLICAMCFFLNIGMYVYFMIPSYATTLDIGAAMPLLGATASSVAMAGQTISKLMLGAVGEKHPQAATIGVIALMALTIVTVIAIERMQQAQACVRASKSTADPSRP